jgi:hypothetical protein
METHIAAMIKDSIILGILHKIVLIIIIFQKIIPKEYLAFYVYILVIIVIFIMDYYFLMHFNY